MKRPGVVLITWSANCSITGAHVESMLSVYRISVLKRQLTNKDHTRDWGIGVSSAQAKWAEYLMLRYGCPVSSPLLNPSHRRLLDNNTLAPMTLPTPWQPDRPMRQPGFTGWLLRTLGVVR